MDASRRSSRPPAADVCPQSRLWFASTAVFVSLLGVALNRRAGTELDVTVAADARNILAALSAFAVLALGFQLVLASTFAHRSSPRAVRRPTSWPTMVAIGAVCGAIAGLAVILAVRAPARFELQLAAGCGVTVAAMVVAVPARSILLGAERWRDLALIGLVAIVPRLFLTVLPIDDSSLWALLAAVVAGEAVATVLALTATSTAERVIRWPHGARRQLLVGVAGAVGLGVFLVLISTTSRSHLGGEADRYSQSASVSRTLFLLLFAVAFVFFPAIATSSPGTARLRRVFHQAFFLTAATAVVALAAFIVFPGICASLIANDDLASPSTVRILAVAFAANGIAIISLMQYISHGSRMALLPLPLAAPMAIAHLTATTATQLAIAALVSSLILLVAVSLPALMRAQPMLRATLVDSAAMHPPVDVADAGTTVVVPSYNPGSIVVDTVQRLLEAFDAANVPVEVVVVSDGSSDRSEMLLDQVVDHRVAHIRHPTNRGKGAALRTGFAMARMPNVAFVDADGDLAPTQLVEMVRVRAERDADIVFGSKRHDESTVDISAGRTIMSWAYHVLIRALFQLDIADTQTGIKVFSLRTIRDALPVVREDGYAFDLELFVSARAMGHGRFVEVPVRLVRGGGSTISSRSVVAVFTDTLRIFWRAKVALRYVRAAAVEPSPVPEIAARAP